MRLAALTLFASVALAQPVLAQQLDDRITVQSCNQIHMDAHAAAVAGEISSQEYDQLWGLGNLCTAIALGRQWAGDDYQYFTVLNMATVVGDEVAVLDNPDSGQVQGWLGGDSRVMVLQGTYAQELNGYSWYQVQLGGHEQQIKSWVRGDFLRIDTPIE